MNKKAEAASTRDKIAALSDRRLKALAFRAWRFGQSDNAKKRARAIRLAPYFRAELKLRNLSGGD